MSIFKFAIGFCIGFIGATIFIHGIPILHRKFMQRRKEKKTQCVLREKEAQADSAHDRGLEYAKAIHIYSGDE